MSNEDLIALIPSAKKIVVGFDGICTLFSDAFFVSKELIKEQLNNANTLSLRVKDISNEDIRKVIITHLESEGYEGDQMNAMLMLPVNHSPNQSTEYSTPSLKLPQSIYEFIMEFRDESWVIDLYDDFRRLNEEELNQLADKTIELLENAIKENSILILKENRAHVRTSISILNDYYKDAYSMIFEFFNPKFQFNESLLYSTDNYYEIFSEKDTRSFYLNQMKEHLEKKGLLGFLNERFTDKCDKIIALLCRQYFPKKKNEITITLQSNTRFFTFCHIIGLVDFLKNLPNQTDALTGNYLLELYHFFEMDLFEHRDAKDTFSRYLKPNAGGVNNPFKDFKEIRKCLIDNFNIPDNLLVETYIKKENKQY